MTRPLKRARIQTEYRARPPRRRKVGSPVYDVDSSDKDQYAARAITQERKRGKRVEYLVDWEPHPHTGETYDPSWEPKENVGDGLIQEWEERNSVGPSHVAHKPSRSLERPTSGDSSEGLIPDRQLDDFIDDTEDNGETPEPNLDSHTPSLIDRESDSSADDYLGPDSPSLEIEETQAQSSLSVSEDTAESRFTLEIPAATFDKSEYSSYTGTSEPVQSIETPAASLPGGEATFPELEHTPVQSTRESSIYYSPPESTPQLLSARGIEYIEDHRDRVQGLSNSPITKGSVQIPASSDTQRQDFPENTGTTTGLVIQESSAENPAFRDSGQTQTSNIYQPLPSQAQWSLSANPTQGDPAEKDLSPISLSHLSSSVQISDPSQTSSPWQFESQLPAVQPRWHSASPSVNQGRQEQFVSHLAAGEARVPSTSPSVDPRRQEQAPKQLLPSPLPNMDLPAIRQSPRLQSATPASRTRSPQRAQQVRRARTPQAFGEGMHADGITASMVTSPLATAPPHIADYNSPPESSYLHDAAMSDPQISSYDQAGVSALPIQPSIEEEPQSSAEEIASKASSSQASLLNERVIPQVDGVSLPTQPVIGPGEWLIGLPAEGKVQSVYTDHINAKRKLIVKFIHRRGSVGSANGSTSRTLERNEMMELMERLQDTTTHLDLGLPNFTQYSIRSEEEMKYAEYAGSKFVFLGELVRILIRVDCSLIIACKQGPVQELLADYLTMRQVQVRRHDRPPSARAGTPDALRDTLKVDIVSTTSDKEINLSAPPALMIAFDSTFDNQSQHIRRIRELYSQGRDQPLAVVHLLVTNSAEHVDRCLRKAMPSPQRLKLLVRGTYLARARLGGTPSYVPYPDDSPADRPMAMHDLQRAVRKSPNRKLQLTAAIVARAALSANFEEHWQVPELPEVHYDEMDDTSPRTSENTTAAGTAAPTPRDGRMRTRSPASRSTTPMGKKRTLDVEAASSMLYKRQRLTPMRDTTPTVESSRDQAKIENLQEQLKAMAIELATEKKARLEAEEARDGARQELTDQSATLKQWQNDHAGLLRRYERQREINRTLYKENKRVIATNENIKAQADKVRETNVKVRGENTQLKKDLADARTDLTSSGGDIATLEAAREEARVANSKLFSAERSLENTKRDFEFTRQQYQQASNRAAELSTQTDDLELQNEQLKAQASDERRRLKELNNAERRSREKATSDMFEQENRALLLTVRKLQEENKVLNKGRGVQTRGSSAQPPNSPGLGNIGRRSRQASPAVVGGRAEREGVQRGAATGGVGGGMGGSGETLLTVPSSGRDRVSAVRNEP